MHVSCTCCPKRQLAFAALGQVQATLGKVSDAMATLEQGLAMRRRHPIGAWDSDPPRDGDGPGRRPGGGSLDGPGAAERPVGSHGAVSRTV